MPLFGKIVIIKRNGTDGTEFPLTTACLFGRKLDCDIRIQIPQVSKEQCRIEQNENKELILTNLSSVNPTRVNGEIVQQSERLKHGDLITIIDRSFRFECPPPPTPKKERLSTNENGEAVKVLQDQQVRSSSAPTDKKKVEHTFDSCLKDGSNLSPALDQSVEVVKGDGSQPIKSSSDGSKSPFYELYNMVKQDLATRSPRRAKAPPSTPLSRPRLNGEEPEKALDAGAATLDKNEVPVTPKHGKKKRRSSVTGATSGDEGVPPLSSAVVHPAEGPPTGTQAGATTAQDSTTKPRRSSSGPATPVPLEGNASLVSLKNTRQATPRKFSETPKSEGSGVSRPQSRAATPERPPALPSTPRPRAADVDQAQTPPTGAGEPEPKQASRTSPRTNAGKRFQIQDMLREFGTTAVSEDKGDVQTSRRKHKMADLPIPVSKRKRVSFGGQLSPELFDKRLPPNSPLRRGATPGRRSLSISQKPQSLLRRASTIGLMSFRLDKAVPKNPAKSASPKRASSPGKKSKVTSPAKASSPAKKAPSPKARTPSPKGKKSPSRTLTPSSGPAMPKTPNSTRRSSDALAKTSNEGSLIQTPATQGRFSVSRVSTPSPISDHGVEAKGEFMCVSAVPDARMTPSLSLRRTSMKASARKTPRSALKSVFDVMRSRRSGASRANLKVISSWADIVKFGQVKVQTEDASKKSVPKRKASKQTKVTQTQTPVRRLKDDTSTGHADSPATVVIGKAYTRSTQLAGAAPKVVSNVALFAKDRKMNEDFTGVAEIFKTPANSKGKGVVGWVSEYPETPSGVSFSTVTEISMMSTPEESGVMMVSPMSVASTAELGRYNSEAVSRLLQDNQDASLIQQDSPQTNGSNDLPASEVISALEMTVEEQTEAEPQTVVQTPLQKPAPSGCLTGVKKLMTTPKQRAEPIEDLRGRLLRTPKEPKAPLEESLEGVKELLTTPKQKGTDLEEMTGLNILQKTPKVKSSPIECAAGFSRLKIPKDKTEKEEDLTGVEQLMRTPKSKGEPVEKAFGLKRLMKTPKQKNKPVEEDLTGIQQMMKTPKQKNKPVEEDLTGIQQMMKTPKQKNKPVEEDLTGIQQMMKTPKQKNKPVEEDLTGIQQMMKTPKQKNKPVEEDLTGIQQMMKTPKQKNKPVEEDLTGIQQMMKTPKQKNKPVEEDLTGIQQMTKTPKQKNKPVEEDLTGIQQMTKTPKQKNKPVEEDLTGIQQMTKTPKQKNKPVEEDLTGIQQMTKTPKQKNKPVEEDLTGIQQMTKTPKQKNKPVEEDLTGIQQMTKTPKQKNKPVEEDLTGIQQMMKTPKQRRAEAVENFTEPAELNQPKSTSNMTETEHDLSSSPKIEEPLVSVASGALDVNCGDQECEDEENVCLPEDTRRESEAAVAIQDVSQIETEKGAETTPRTIAGQSDKENEVISVETSSCEEEGSAREPPVEAECTSQAGDATPSLVALKQVGRSRNVNKTPRGTRAKAAQKPQQCGHADAVSGKYEHASVGAVETAPALRGKGGEGAVKLLESTPLSTPARKSSRGRIPKRHFEETVTVVLKSTQESADGERDSECLPAAKGRRGRNAKRDVKVEPVLETKVAADLTAAEPAEAGASEKLPARVAKGKRGQRAKEESENSPLAPTTQEPQGLNVPETVVVEADMAPECGELQSLAEPNTKPRRGRRTKKEPLKAAAGEETTKSTPASVEADSSDVPVSGHAQTSAVKPGRGRRVKPGALMGQVATAEPEEVAELVGADPVAADPVAVVQPPARSSRRTKSRALKTQSDDQNEPSTMFAEPGQNAEATVKNTRGGRRVKQPKAYSLEDTQDETKGNPQVECETVAQVEAPTIKSGRGQRVAAARDGMGGPVKRGRHAAAIAKVSPAVKSTRARKTAVKIEDAPVPEEPVRETITPVPQMGPGGAEDTGSVVADKKRRGRMAKKAKVSSEDDPVVEAEELITAKESENRKTTKKNVNWNSDLVCWRNIEEVELPGAKEECKQMSKKKAVPVATAVESIASETKRPEDPPADNRRQEEPAAKQFAEVDAPRVRRGRAPASKPDDDVARVKRGHNRKATEAAADDLPIAEPSPGTKAGKAATGVPRRTRRGAAAKQVAEAPEAEAAQRQPVANDNASKPARGRRKAPQDGGAQVPTKEATPRRGTRVQKPADRAESAAPPPKRTRRK